MIIKLDFGKYNYDIENQPDYEDKMSYIADIISETV